MPSPDAALASKLRIDADFKLLSTNQIADCREGKGLAIRAVNI